MTIKIKELTIRAIVNSDRSSNSTSKSEEEQKGNASLAKHAFEILHKKRENRER